MTQSLLLKKIHSDGIKFNGVSSDTRTLVKGNLFFAIKGSNSDGLNYIDHAYRKDASAVVISNRKKISNISERLPIYIVKDVRKEFAIAAFSINKNNITHKIGVTGTNGKTSVTFYINYILDKINIKSATIGTLGNSVFKKNKGNLTTPSSLDLARQLSAIYRKKIDHVSIEASSHGLDQKRFSGLQFNVGILTNISRDHLDYHKTMDNYISSKAKLFNDYLSQNAKIIINSETKYLTQFLKKIKNLKSKELILFQKNNDFKLLKINLRKNDVNVSVIISGKKFNLVFSSLPLFQIKNFLIAASAVSCMGYNLANLSTISKKCPNVSGRMEYVGLSKKGGKVYVDFAHTPDALLNVLKEIKQTNPSKIILIFGCGGDRDKGKRSKMGVIAKKYADIVIVTDDNPRYEDATKIRKEIIQNSNFFVEISNRKKAIKHGISKLEKKSVLLIAGKGHEKTQIIKGKIYNFDDVVVAKKLMKQI